MSTIVNGKYYRFKNVDTSLKSPPHRGVIGNGSEIPELTRDDLIARGLIVDVSEVARGLNTRRLPGKRQWMHTAGKTDMSPLFQDEPIDGCGYCMGEILHSHDLHKSRLSVNVYNTYQKAS
jgi:hypothetical protein